jgi:4-carboxymuconolactone decarboxylase
MRLPPIAPADLTAAQRPLYEDMRAGVAAKYDLFTTARADGALLGPWNAWLHQPEVGTAFWTVTKAMTAFKVLPDAVRQVAILAVGARFGAAYEIYAHGAVARARHGMGDGRLATLAAGERPADLTEAEAAAFDVARALTAGGVLPEPTYRRALALFGQAGTSELIYLIGHYCFVSMTLNGFAIPVPEEEPAPTEEAP